MDAIQSCGRYYYLLSYSPCGFGEVLISFEEFFAVVHEAARYPTHPQEWVVVTLNLVKRQAHSLVVVRVRGVGSS